VSSTNSPTAVAEELGNRLKQARLNADLTQTELSEKSGISVKMIQGAERGKAQLVTIIAILQALDLADQLNNFLKPQEISPLQLMKLQGKERQRASRRKPTSEQDDTAW